MGNLIRNKADLKNKELIKPKDVYSSVFSNEKCSLKFISGNGKEIGIDKEPKNIENDTKKELDENSGIFDAVYYEVSAKTGFNVKTSVEIMS